MFGLSRLVIFSSTRVIVWVLPHTESTALGGLVPLAKITVLGGLVPRTEHGALGGPSHVYRISRFSHTRDTYKD